MNVRLTVANVSKPAKYTQHSNMELARVLLYLVEANMYRSKAKQNVITSFLINNMNSGGFTVVTVKQLQNNSRELFAKVG